MQRIVFDHATPLAAPPVLAQPEQPSGKLLALIANDKTQHAALIRTYVSEGWNVLEVKCGASGGQPAASAIFAAIRQSLDALNAGAGHIFLTVVIDRDVEAAAYEALLQIADLDRTSITLGLITLNAFANNTTAALCRKLAERPNLSTVWLVERALHDVRRLTFEHHTALQCRGHDSRFIAIPADSRSIARHIVDPRAPAGREARWLLEPIHSRSA